jgi:hypothetical protein
VLVGPRDDYVGLPSWSDICSDALFGPIPVSRDWPERVVAPIERARLSARWARVGIIREPNDGDFAVGVVDGGVDHPGDEFGIANGE